MIFQLGKLTSKINKIPTNWGYICGTEGPAWEISNHYSYKVFSRFIEEANKEFPRMLNELVGFYK